MDRAGALLLLPFFAGCAAVFGFDDLVEAELDAGSDSSGTGSSSSSSSSGAAPGDAASGDASPIDAGACLASDFLCTEFADDSSLESWSIDPGDGSVLADRGLSLYLPGNAANEEVSARWDGPAAWRPNDNLHFEVTFAIPERPSNGEMLGAPVTLYFTGDTSTSDDASSTGILSMQLREDETTRLVFDQGLGPNNAPPVVLEPGALPIDSWQTLVVDLRANGGGYRITWNGTVYNGVLPRTRIPVGSYFLQFSLDMASAMPTELRIARTVLRAE